MSISPGSESDCHQCVKDRRTSHLGYGQIRQEIRRATVRWHRGKRCCNRCRSNYQTPGPGKPTSTPGRSESARPWAGTVANESYVGSELKSWYPELHSNL